MADRSRSDERVVDPPSAPAAEPPAHVVVVDDQAVVRTFLSEALRAAGFRVTTAAEGGEALEAVRRDPAQVVLTDLAMRGMDGHELLRNLREAHPSIVPVVLTGVGSVQSAVDLMRQGVFDVLTKPCRAPEVVTTVAKASRHHEALRLNSELRERLRLQEKLAMIGKLAAGVAHELNNPLDAVLRCVRLARDRVEGDAESREMLDIAQAGLLRMADIVRSLLTFSRQAAVEQSLQPLRALVEEAAGCVSMALGDAAPAFRTDVGDPVAGVRVPRGLQQVLVNVLRNAADATGPTGTVSVRCAREGDRLRVRVEDDGPGMPQAVLDRAFEPFFTTKPPGKGTGLGLPISARIVEKFGGAIALECPAEGGTAVTVTLPLAGAASVAAA
jgi:signal transduction histidine kinase